MESHAAAVRHAQSMTSESVTSKNLGRGELLFCLIPGLWPNLDRNSLVMQESFQNIAAKWL